MWIPQIPYWFHMECGGTVKYWLVWVFLPLLPTTSGSNDPQRVGGPLPSTPTIYNPNKSVWLIGLLSSLPTTTSSNNPQQVCMTRWGVPIPSTNNLRLKQPPMNHRDLFGGGLWLKKTQCPLVSGYRSPGVIGMPKAKWDQEQKQVEQKCCQQTLVWFFFLPSTKILLMFLIWKNQCMWLGLVLRGSVTSK